MDYYQKRDNAYRHLKNMLNEAMQQKKEVSKTAILFVLTNKFQVSDLAVQKWLIMFQKLGFIKIEKEETIIVIKNVE